MTTPRQSVCDSTSAKLRAAAPSLPGLRTMIGLDGFGQLLVHLHNAGAADLERVLIEVSRIHGSDQFEDDASILKVRFG